MKMKIDEWEQSTVCVSNWSPSHSSGDSQSEVKDVKKSWNSGLCTRFSLSLSLALVKKLTNFILYLIMNVFYWLQLIMEEEDEIKFIVKRAEN